jgi:hypothetical protein
MTNDKPYFTKYLPIEGEIKEGDKYFAYGHIQTCTTTAKDLLVGLNKNYKLHKLFLCSRDIQVGDKFTRGDIAETALDIVEGDIQFKDTKNLMQCGTDFLFYWPVKECFKVIGEISPDALSYVKEGDEFDEDEVQWCYRESVGLSASNDKEDVAYRIQCPNCKHFH